MKLTAILDIALTVFLVILVIAAIWFVIELARVLRSTRNTIDEVQKSIEPLVSNVNVILENAQPVVAKIDPLVEHATLTIDAVNLEIMRLDPILDDLGKTTGTLSGAVDGIANAPTKLANSISDALNSIPIPGMGKVATAAANMKSKVAAHAAPAAEAPKTYTTVGADAAPAAKASCEERIQHASHVKADEAAAIEDADDPIEIIDVAEWTEDTEEAAAE